MKTVGIVEIGRGVLTWNRCERVCDRYGAVWLMREGGDSLNPAPKEGLRASSLAYEGQRGRLVAEVLATRESTHIGDLFHGVFPTTPEVGEKIPLGYGSLFFELDTEGNVTIGLQPEDGRETLWMDIHALYRAHEQTVSLQFAPD